MGQLSNSKLKSIYLKEDYDTSGTFGGGCTLWDYSKFGIELDINLFSFIILNTYKESNN